MVIDLVVAGGGPVGLGMATLAARSGMRVTVVEPRATPIDKACGEGLMPGAVASLLEIGARPSGHPFTGIHYRHGSETGSTGATARFTAGPGLGVRRTELHSALSEAAAEAGVELVHGAVGDIRQYPDHVEASLTGHPHGSARARYLIAADGLHSPLRQQLGLTLPSGKPRRYGLRQHFAVEPWSEYVEVHWVDDAEAYVTPVAPDMVGVAVLFSGRGAYEPWLRRFPDLAERLGDAERVSAIRGAGPLRQRARRRVAGRVLLAGDAAGYVDAITGEGVNLGLATGAQAINCIRNDRPDDYEQAWMRVSRTYRLFTAGLVRAGQCPPLRRRIVPAAAALPGLYQRAIDLIAR